jgi:hypothetical protein
MKLGEMIGLFFLLLTFSAIGFYFGKDYEESSWNEKIQDIQIENIQKMQLMLKKDFKSS